MQHVQQMLHQQGGAKVVQPIDLDLLQVRAQFDTGHAGKPACQVLDLRRLQGAQFGQGSDA